MEIMSTYYELKEYTSNKVSTWYFTNITCKVNKKIKVQDNLFKPLQMYTCGNDHNNLRNPPLSLEATWFTQRCPNRVLSFLLEILEVKCYLEFWAFMWVSKTSESVLGGSWAAG